MIFYFSGTSNSKYIAYLLAKSLNDKVYNIAQCIDDKSYNFTIEQDEKVGFVFPIYAWRAPEMVISFIKKLNFCGNSIYFYALATCGEDCGLAMRKLEKTAKKNKIDLKLFKSIQMPNNFIPMSDIDSEEEIKLRLKKAQEIILDISKKINKNLTVYEVSEGKGKFIKSNIIAPLFNKFFKASKGLFADENCIKCNLCQTICPTHNISFDEKINFGKNCTNCLACLHSCPQKAIQFNKTTQNKGRYVCPKELIDKLKN